jgi:[ribosomal protein S5]-alanine N-acetyltransferase
VLPAAVPVLDAPPVRLRPWRDDDIELVVSVADDPLIPLVTTVPTSGRTADAAAYVERQRGRLVEGLGYSFAVADAATDEGVGQIGLWTGDITAGRASTGYWVAPAHRGRGWATAALRALVAWTATIEEVERLELYVEPWNEGSWRAAEAAGFEREGLLRRWQRVGGERRDMYVYSVVG